MITITLDDNELINLLMQRLSYWTNDTEVLILYNNYFNYLIDNGAMYVFDGIISYIDNLYVNETAVSTQDELLNYGITNDDDRILYKDNDLYLIQAN